MHLPSRLIKSRHGIFYYRFQFQVQDKRKEYRISLHTKSPTLAKAKSLLISAIIIKNRFEGNGMANGFDQNDMSTWGNIIGDQANIRKLDIEMGNGVSLRNIKNADDEARAIRMIKALNFEFKQTASPATESIIPVKQEGDKTIHEMIERYATASSQKLSAKTQYEYGNYQRKFTEWIAIKKNNKNLPIRLITSGDIGNFIHDLRSKTLKDDDGKETNIRELTDRNIQQKYLASLGGVFELAQTLGAYPKGDIPTRGHHVFTKKDHKNNLSKTKYLPFTDAELSSIFDPKNFLAQPRPADYWLPLLALYTGGRISELCQMAVTDVDKEDGIWYISINDEDYKRVKTEAAIRKIPMHAELIGLGFTDYIEDVKPFGGMLFPYLVADPFGNFSGTPSERFGKYLDSLNIKHKQKVFHSFRSTANNRLKANGVTEETRCQFIGHEYDTTNSGTYSEPHTLEFLLQNAAAHLNYNSIDFDKIAYQKGAFTSELEKLCLIKAKGEARKKFLAKKQLSRITKL